MVVISTASGSSWKPMLLVTHCAKTKMTSVISIQGTLNNIHIFKCFNINQWKPIFIVLFDTMNIMVDIDVRRILSKKEVQPHSGYSDLSQQKPPKMQAKYDLYLELLLLSYFWYRRGKNIRFRTKSCYLEWVGCYCEGSLSQLTLSRKWYQFPKNLINTVGLSNFIFYACCFHVVWIVLASCKRFLFLLYSHFVQKWLL